MKKTLRLVWLAFAAVGLMASSAAAGELKVGDKAPNFSLQASDGKTYSLADFKGKQAVVLAWFPKAYTRGCTIECKSLAEHGDMIKAYDAKYFMISVDTLDDNKGFADQQHADFPLLADPSKTTADAYGVLNQGGVAYRWTFYTPRTARSRRQKRSSLTRPPRHGREAGGPRPLAPRLPASAVRAGGRARRRLPAPLPRSTPTIHLTDPGYALLDLLVTASGALKTALLPARVCQRLISRLCSFGKHNEVRLLIRIKALPSNKELEEYDLRRFQIGERYDVQAQLASVLIIGGYAEPLSSSSPPAWESAADRGSRRKR